MKFDSGWGSTPGACNVPPDPLAGYKGASKGREVGEEGHFSPPLRTLHKCQMCTVQPKSQVGSLSAKKVRRLKFEHEQTASFNQQCGDYHVFGATTGNYSC